MISEREKAAIQKIKNEFPRMHDRLMPESVWQKTPRDVWGIAVKGWLDIMLKEEARPLGIQIDFFPEQVEVTRNMFGYAMWAQAYCLDIEPNKELVDKTFDDSWNEFFPDRPDVELFIDIRQLDEAFRSLVVDPARLLGQYLMLKTSAEAIK